MTFIKGFINSSTGERQSSQIEISSSPSCSNLLLLSVTKWNHFTRWDQFQFIWLIWQMTRLWFQSKGNRKMEWDIWINCRWYLCIVVYVYLNYSCFNKWEPNSNPNSNQFSKKCSLRLSCPNWIKSTCWIELNKKYPPIEIKYLIHRFIFE